MQPQRFVAREAHRGMRLDRFLQAMVPRMSRSAVQQAIATRVELGSGAPPKPARTLVPGDVVTIHPRPATGVTHEVPRILIERDGWLACDKPAGLASTPHARRPGEDAATLLDASPAHRLDRMTSGCLLLVRDAPTARHFEACFRRREVSKRYLAVVHGVPARAQWTCEAAIGAHSRSRVPGRMQADGEEAGADRQPAVTTFEVLAATPSTALVLAEPRTGRRHQIRVHLALGGHPIVGDLLYGEDERHFVRDQLARKQGGASDVGRHLLHAWQLAFEAPEGGRITVCAPVPADFPSELVDEIGEL